MTSNQALQGEDPQSVVEATIERSKAEDPVFRFLFNNWQRVLTVIAVLAVGAYIFRGYSQTQEKSLRRAAEVYFKVRDSFEQYEAAKQARTAVSETDAEAKQKADLAVVEAKKLVEQRLSAFSDIEKSPYKEISQLYRTLFALEEGDKEQAISSLSGAQQAIGVKGKGDSLIVELQALVLGRTLLDSPDKREEGKGILKLLVEKGQYANAAAASALARIADSPAEKQEARALIEQLRSRFPEQSDLLKKEANIF